MVAGCVPGTVPYMSTQVWSTVTRPVSSSATHVKTTAKRLPATYVQQLLTIANKANCQAFAALEKYCLNDKGRMKNPFCIANANVKEFACKTIFSRHN